jgi:hypothetical protein
MFQFTNALVAHCYGEIDDRLMNPKEGQIEFDGSHPTIDDENSSLLDWKWHSGMQPPSMDRNQVKLTRK